MTNNAKRIQSRDPRRKIILILLIVISMCIIAYVLFACHQANQFVEFLSLPIRAILNSDAAN